MGVGCTFGNHELGCDLAVRQTARNQYSDLAFPRGKRHQVPRRFIAFVRLSRRVRGEKRECPSDYLRDIPLLWTRISAGRPPRAEFVLHSDPVS